MRSELPQHDLIARVPAGIGCALCRRKLLRVGTLAALGLSASQVARLRAESGRPARAKSCIFIFLFGGPSQIDLWDMKPAAPREIRGEFQPIATCVPGIEVCEHLPHLARAMDRLCLVRSMTHQMPVHGPACSEITTGRPYFGPPTTDEARPEDWPSLSALVTRYGTARGALPASIVLPWYTQFVGQARRIAGQTGGRMGETWNGTLIAGDAERGTFVMPGLEPREEVPAARVERRRRMSEQLERLSPWPVPAEEAIEALERQRRLAMAMIEEPAVARAFQLEREPAATRERYGSTLFGQSLLLARRLVEAGTSLVTVNWDDPSGADKVSPHWDTHHQNFPKLKERLCPVFDQAYPAFIDDLAQRGLLDETLVVAVGEFGRSPKIGQFTQNAMTEKTGRDHWPHAFTALLAGGGVPGGLVHGATGRTGGFVTDAPVTPADLAATVLTHLGIDPSLEYFDEFQRIRQRLCTGQAVRWG